MGENGAILLGEGVLVLEPVKRQLAIGLSVCVDEGGEKVLDALRLENLPVHSGCPEGLSGDGVAIPVDEDALFQVEPARVVLEVIAVEEIFFARDAARKIRDARGRCDSVDEAHLVDCAVMAVDEHFRESDELLPICLKGEVELDGLVGYVQHCFPLVVKKTMHVRTSILRRKLGFARLRRGGKGQTTDEYTPYSLT